jgi:RNA polymerase sigma factor (sigma-70 family)
MATGLRRVLGQLEQAGVGVSDGQLLSRFITTRDEPSFAALVRRHGPMVFGVCRRILRDFHHAEDAFQATFLVLARRAPAIVVGESLACWLYGVAYRTALEAQAMSARRRTHEKLVRNLPHPAVMPADAQDWRPLLDRELNVLPKKYRAAIVLCDLEGRPRREAARLLGIGGNTLSSRLARARGLLAKRLARCGVVLSAGALPVVIAEGEASAALPAALILSTARAAALLAAGQMASVSTPAILLMKGVMKAMLMKKLRFAAGAAMLVVALGTAGIGYQATGAWGVANAAPPDKPRSELDALRHENELLKTNLEVVLEKVRAQEAELREFRAQRGGGGVRTGSGPGMSGGGGPGPGMGGAPGMGPPGMPGSPGAMGPGGGPPTGPGPGGMPPGTGPGMGPPGAPGQGPGVPGQGGPFGPQGMGPPGHGAPGSAPGGMPPGNNPPRGGAGGPMRMGSGTGTPGRTADPLQEAEAALKALREAKDKDARQQATDRLEKALKKLKRQQSPTGRDRVQDEEEEPARSNEQ